MLIKPTYHMVSLAHELEVQVGGEFDQIDKYGNTGPRRMEGLRTRRMKRGGYCGALIG